MSYIKKLQQLDADEYDIIEQNRVLLQQVMNDKQRSPECILESIRVERMYLQKAKERCISVGRFLMDAYFNSKVSLELEQYRALIKSQNAFCFEFAVNPYLIEQSNLSKEGLIEDLGYNVGQRVFDSTGGNFISAFVEASFFEGGILLRCCFILPEESKKY